MRIYIIFFLLLNTLLLGSDSAFNIKILNKINLLNYEMSQSVDESLKKRLNDEKDALVEYFLEKLEDGDFTTINKNNQEEKYISDLLELRDAQAKGDKLAILIAQMKLQTVHMERTFETLLVTVKEYSNSLKPLKDYRELFVKYSETMIFSNKKYKIIYEKILKKSEITQKEQEFLNIYNHYIDRQNVYSEIFYAIAARTIETLSTNTILTSLEIDNLITYFNALDELSTLNDRVKEYFKISVGQLLVSIMFIVFIVIFKKIVIDTILFILDKLFKKKSTDSQIKLNTYLDNSLRVPFRYFLYVVAIDISLRILFMSVDNENIVSYFMLIYILILIWASFRLINNFVVMYSNNMLQNYPNVRGEMINFFVNFLKSFVIIVGFLVIFSNLGYDVSGVIASLGIGGLAVAFAARETISNIFGSISVILDNTFTQGDWIVADGAEGTVVDIGMRTTKIRTFDNSMIYVPNSIMASSKVKNWNKRVVGRRIYMHLGATYSSSPQDLKNAVDQIKEMLVQHDGVADDNFQEEKSYSRKMSRVVSSDMEYGVKKTLFVHVDKFSESSIDIMVYCFSKSVVWGEWLKVKEDVMYKIMDIFEKNNLSFAFPSQSIYLNNEDEKPLQIQQGEPQ
ncbi:MAG: mechanosensitive ion channel [Campylobacterota bacterium]|nr:mechanosensitive ion channel [Campylobacterota bacterium]